ncbi:MAG: hypothetical protein ACC618_03875 [Patescibacteria group bacterium]
MEIRRGESNPKLEDQETLRSDHPSYVLIDRDFNVYWSVKDAANEVELSPGRIQDIVKEQRVVGVKPAGHDWFVSIDSLREYVDSGKVKPGPKPKS